MQESIQTELKNLAAAENIRILLAVESGSRVWGMESANSDWDVRFVYVRQPAQYLRLSEGRDSIERMLPGDIDLSGWDLRKALHLLRKGNPSLLEWLRSPLVYAEEYSTAAALRIMTQNYFNPITTFHHYLHMARGNFHKYLEKEMQVKAKKYLYVLRPQLACLWVLNHNSHPPLAFEDLLTGAKMEANVRLAIEQLVIEKKKGDELGAGPRNETLHAFIESTFEHLNAEMNKLRPGEAPPLNLLDELFIGTLREVYPSFFGI